MLIKMRAGLSNTSKNLKSRSFQVSFPLFFSAQTVQTTTCIQGSLIEFSFPILINRCWSAMTSLKLIPCVIRNVWFFSCHWGVMERIQMCNMKCLCLKPLISPVLQSLGSSFATCRWCPVCCIRNYCWAIGRVCLLMRMWNCVICIITVKELSTKQPSSHSCMIALFLQHLQIKLAPARSQHSSAEN